MDAAQSSETLYCAECGRPSRSDELARFGNLMICSSCKESYAQKLRECAAQPARAAYAGFWIRFVSSLIDGIILGVVVGILQVAVFGSMFLTPAFQQGRTPDPTVVAPFLGLLGIMYVVQIALASSYEAFFVAKLGATPGKMVIGVKVLRPDGSPVSLGRAYGRYFSKFISALTLFIGFIMAGFDSQKRALHDMICDTRVVKSRT
jgi:uncharacterized RDD family membrane protein YckC